MGKPALDYSLVMKGMSSWFTIKPHTPSVRVWMRTYRLILAARLSDQHFDQRLIIFCVADHNFVNFLRQVTYKSSVFLVWHSGCLTSE